jgi:hypothetical protein
MPSDLQAVQRFLTTEFITKRRLLVQALWLRPESAAPSAEDAVKPSENLACDLHEWTDDRNLGARLTDGFIELKIQSPDDVWTQCLFKAFRSLRADARAAYGLAGQPVSSILFKIAAPDSIDGWEQRWPRGHRDKAGEWVATKFVYSLAATARAKPVWRNSSPLPGSRFSDRLVQWRPLGKPPAEDEGLGLEDLEARPIAATNMETICRAIAFATLGYYVQAYLDGLTQWDESLTRTIGGWLARLILEGAAINAKGKSLEGVCWAPIDSEDTAKRLLTYLDNECGAPHDLSIAFSHAQTQLERNPQAHIPSWRAIETHFGPHARVGMRAAFRAGLDLDVLEQMSERYFYDKSTDRYIDRKMLLDGLSFLYDDVMLTKRHANEEPLWLNNKRSINPFKVYMTSKLRSEVSRQDFFPGEEPGGILRFSRTQGLLKNEDYYSDEYLAFNTFRGFTIKPIATINPAVMRSVITMLDRTLGLLTKDHDERMAWLKKFIAHIAQYPAEKPQVCPILVGGQGIGKSLFGGEVMRAIFDDMAGNANGYDFTDNKFVITPFIGKLITFIDEIRLESVQAVNTIKKLVRSDRLSGQEKYATQRDYYIPSRLMIATNSPNIGLTSDDTVDRAFYFILSSTPENMKMSEREFADWAVGLKPFYNSFIEALKSYEARQHLMRYFMEIEVERSELEDLTHSSRGDENIILSTMSRTRMVARQMVAEGHIVWALDITAWFTEINIREAIKRIDGSRSRIEAYQIILEFERAGVIETARGGYYKFKWGYGKLLTEFGKAHGLPIQQAWDFQPGDFNDNDVRSTSNPPTWRGLRHGQPREEPRYRDPDYLEPE